VSFWDQIRPAIRAPQPVDLAVSEDRLRLKIRWDDGRSTEPTGQQLRRRCPCAACIDEWTQRQTLDPASVPPSLEIVEVKAVGNYAIGLTFGDGHRTGIYPWPLLRALE
jgi:DUF971 family protein